MKLYFLRHGLADRSAWSGPDRLRPLTPHGRRRIERTAELFDRIGLRPDLILSSPLARARQTAEIVADRLDLDERLHDEPRLGLAFGPRELAGIVADHEGVRSLLLVGHEPGFSTTVSAVTGGSELVFKKGALARVDLHEMRPPAGELVWLVPPKVLDL